MNVRSFALKEKGANSRKEGVHRLAQLCYIDSIPVAKPNP